MIKIMTFRGEFMHDMLKKQIQKFNDRLKTDEKLQKEMEGIVRTIQIDVEDGATYYTTIKDNCADELKEGSIEQPDILIKADEATLSGLINKEISPIKAFLITKKLKVEASLEDKLRLRKFFE
jgi:putative sterol carrier protein